LRNLSQEEQEENLYNLQDLIENFSIDDFNIDFITETTEILKEEGDNYGVSLFVAQKKISRHMKCLWENEISMKPYFIYFSIFSLSTLELGGTFCI